MVEPVADPHEDRVRIGAPPARRQHGEDVGALAPMDLAGAVDHAPVADLGADEGGEARPRGVVVGRRHRTRRQRRLGDDGAARGDVEVGVGEDAVPGLAHRLGREQQPLGIERGHHRLVGGEGIIGELVHVAGEGDLPRHQRLDEGEALDRVEDGEVGRVQRAGVEEGPLLERPVGEGDHHRALGEALDELAAGQAQPQHHDVEALRGAPGEAQRHHRRTGGGELVRGDDHGALVRVERARPLAHGAAQAGERRAALAVAGLHVVQEEGDVGRPRQVRRDHAVVVDGEVGDRLVDRVAHRHQLEGERGRARHPGLDGGLQARVAHQIEDRPVDPRPVAPGASWTLSA